MGEGLIGSSVANGLWWDRGVGVALVGAWPKEGALTDRRGWGFKGRGLYDGRVQKGAWPFKAGAWSLGWRVVGVALRGGVAIWGG